MLITPATVRARAKSCRAVATLKLKDSNECNFFTKCQQKSFQNFFSTLKDWNNHVIVRKQRNFIETLPVNKATSVRSSFSPICETCSQVVHDVAVECGKQNFFKNSSSVFVNSRFLFWNQVFTKFAFFSKKFLINDMKNSTKNWRTRDFEFHGPKKFREKGWVILEIHFPTGLNRAPQLVFN